MIEFNLLPDVKVEYLKTERVKRMVFTIALIVAGSSLVITLILFAALQLQNHQISSNKKEIKQLSATLTGTTDINKVLTIQNQLKTVVGLYNQSPESTRLFGYLTQLVPQNVSISNLSLDFSTNTLKLNGAAPSLETVNTFADTLKFAKYSDSQSPGQSTNAFKSVVLSSFSRDSKAATYGFSMTFDPLLFDRTKKITLVVPKDYVSTRSFTDLPSNDLFKPVPSSNKGSN